MKLDKNFCRKTWQIFVLSLTFITVLYACSSNDGIHYSYTVSMEQPGNHYFHVELTCKNQTAGYIDFKMPVWTPGYYDIQNLSKNVTNFKAFDSEGNPLLFSKKSKNTWRVETNGIPVVKISYEVYANELFIATSYLDASVAFISPTGVFMFPDGQLDQPSLVHFKSFSGGNSISTGLDEIEGQPNTFFASDFDVLFDCPILIGDHDVIEFSVKGVPHKLAVSKKDTLDKDRFINDMTRVIEAATSMMGDIPYKHYTFITIGSYRGGLEHCNSCALSCPHPVADTSDMEEYKRWLSFVTHEYFHSYNVKAIRPIALGPFDYDKESYTNMLWVSEGFTVYYESILLNKAGIFTREDCFKNFSESITGYENRQGHLMESVTSSSFDAWIHYFSPNGDARNNTISYYDKGCALGLFLDLEIRKVTDNKKSLDDVMRALYNTYYLDRKRGFTDEEFRETCEEIAGTGLDEIFTYAGTVCPINYPKYFDYAGLMIDTASHVVEGEVYLGASMDMEHGECRLNQVERNSPAWNSGLGNNQQVLAIGGKDINDEVIREFRDKYNPGDEVAVRIKVGDRSENVDIILSPKTERTFNIDYTINPSAVQKSVLDSWLKE